MELYKYFPIANDRMGTIWTLAAIKDACIIEFGPSGTTHYAVEGIGSLNGEDAASIYSTHMDDSDVTFGKMQRLELAIRELDQNLKPKYIFVLASSISAIIGSDIESVCFDLETQVNATLIPLTTGGLKYQYPKGIENTLLMLVKKLVKPHEVDKKRYNILGFTMDKYNYQSDVEEMKRMMSVLFDKEVNTIFTCGCGIDELERASQASLNIVVRKEALKAAKYMEKHFGIPYVYQNIYGLENIKLFIKAVQTVAGYELDEVNYEKELALLKPHLFSVKRKFMFYKESKDCAVYGDYDTVVGFKDLLTELNLNVAHQEVIYNETSDKTITSGRSEFERMKHLKEQSYYLLLGDGPTLDMSHHSKLDIQISNPNLHQINVYPYTPYMGFRGMHYIIEKILNIRA